jgi:hypothetical protein
MRRVLRPGEFKPITGKDGCSRRFDALYLSMDCIAGVEQQAKGDLKLLQQLRRKTNVDPFRPHLPDARLLIGYQLLAGVNFDLYDVKLVIRRNGHIIKPPDGRLVPFSLPAEQ